MLLLDDDLVLRSDLFADCHEWIAEHGFGTRHASAWPVERTATLKQIHSCHVFAVTGPCEGGELGEGDALVTNVPGVALSIRTADCVPILLVDPVRRVAAAVHAGWRGTQQRILRHTVDRMLRAYGCEPRDIRAAIGPAIGPCCYEVSEEVAVQFEGFRERCGKVHLDLPEINQKQLLAAGLVAEQIDLGRYCTRCGDANLWHSFRRDGERSGRMHAVIALRS